MYVIEFKYKDCGLDEPAEEKQRLSTLALNEAMAQIKEKGYAEKYSGKGKTVHQVALACIGRSNIEMRTELVRFTPTP